MQEVVTKSRSGFVIVFLDDSGCCYHVIDTSGGGGSARGMIDDKRWRIESLLREIKAEPLPDMKPGERVTLHAMEITDAAFPKRQKDE